MIPMNFTTPPVPGVMLHIYGTICYYAAFKRSKCLFLHVTFSSLEAKPLRKLSFYHKDKMLLSSQAPWKCKKSWKKYLEKKVEKMLKIPYFQHFFDDFQHLFNFFFNLFFSIFFAFLGPARTKQNFILMVKSQFP